MCGGMKHPKGLSFIVRMQIRTKFLNLQFRGELFVVRWLERIDCNEKVGYDMVGKNMFTISSMAYQAIV